MDIEYHVHWGQHMPKVHCALSEVKHLLLRIGIYIRPQPA